MTEVAKFVPEPPEGGWTVRLHPKVEGELVVGLVDDRLKVLKCMISLLRNLEHWPPSLAQRQQFCDDMGIHPMSSEQFNYYMMQFEGEPTMAGKKLKVFLWCDEVKETIWVVHAPRGLNKLAVNSVKRRVARRIREIQGYRQDERNGGENRRSNG